MTTLRDEIMEYKGNRIDNLSFNLLILVNILLLVAIIINL